MIISHFVCNTVHSALNSINQMIFSFLLLLTRRRCPMQWLMMDTFSQWHLLSKNGSMNFWNGKLSDFVQILSSSEHSFNCDKQLIIIRQIVFVRVLASFQHSVTARGRACRRNICQRYVCTSCRRVPTVSWASSLCLFYSLALPLAPTPAPPSANIEANEL